jgi:hypothetical protein
MLDVGGGNAGPYRMLRRERSGCIECYEKRGTVFTLRAARTRASSHRPKQQQGGGGMWSSRWKKQGKNVLPAYSKKQWELNLLEAVAD